MYANVQPVYVFVHGHTGHVYRTYALAKYCITRNAFPLILPLILTPHPPTHPHTSSSPLLILQSYLALTLAFPLLRTLTLALTLILTLILTLTHLHVVQVYTPVHGLILYGVSE